MKDLLRTTRPYFWWRTLRGRATAKRDLDLWRASGQVGIPPHQVKQDHVIRLQRKYHVNVFVETGTLFGDMVEAVRPYFGRIYSIELSDYYHRVAVSRFRGRKDVRIIKGDSGEKLQSVLDELDEPAIFWLDAHYSGNMTAHGDRGTPLVEELSAICSDQLAHVVLVDDAHCLGSEQDYPSLEELRALVASFPMRRTVDVVDNVIVIEPQSA